MVGEEKLTSRPFRPSPPKASEDFVGLVRDALSHLYDPAYLQTHRLTHYLQADTTTRGQILGRILRQALLEAIEALHPGAENASDLARHSRILQLRYVEGLDAQEVQAKLALSRTHYYREQAAAVEAVASVLEARWGIGRWGLGGTTPLPQNAPRLDPKPRHNLSVALTSFVGREREIAEVRRLLETTRLLTLTGTGGCGKTRLAYEIGSDLVEAYSDGVWVIELASLTNPDLVPQVVASALSVPQRPDQSILSALLFSLRSKHLLLVLDNCEHLLDACATLADGLLRGCPHLRIFATSREPIGIPGETCYRVPSLSVPDLQHLPSPDMLATYEAVRLFIERATAVEPGFAVTARNAQAAARVCWRLDGIPLAIELAAARVRGLTVEQIAARLDDRFSLLTGGSRTALRRQQTLQATIDWSYDLLSVEEQTLLSRLSVFAGSWTLETAEALCSGAEVASLEVFDLVLHLVEKSLVVADTGSEPARYRLTETIRQYAQEQLVRQSDVEPLRQRHAEHYLALVDRLSWTPQADPEVAREEASSFALLELELPDLRAALRWLADMGQADKVVRFAAASAYGLAQRGYVVEALQWVTEALALPGEPETVSQRIQLLQTVSILAYWQDDFSAARQYDDEQLRLARGLGDKRSACIALQWSAWALAATGEHTLAKTLVDESLKIARELGERGLLWWGIYTGGAAARVAGDDERARTLLEQAISINAQPSPGFLLVGPTSVKLGHILKNQGEYHRAADLFVSSIVESRELGLRRSESQGLVGLAGLAARTGRPKRAVRLFGAAATILMSMGCNLDFDERLDAERDEAAAREALGEDAFAKAWAEGQAMGLEAAVEYALEDGGDA